MDVSGFDVKEEVTAEANEASGHIRVVCEHCEVAEDGTASCWSMIKDMPVDARRFNLSSVRVEQVEGVEDQIIVAVDTKTEADRDDTWTPVLVSIED